MGQIIEVTTFTLKPGVTVEEFLAADRTMAETYVSKLPGFISRQTAAGENGSRLLLAWWADTASADASMAGFATAPATATFMVLIQANTMILNRYTIDG